MASVPQISLRTNKSWKLYRNCVRNIWIGWKDKMKNSKIPLHYITLKNINKKLAFNCVKHYIAQLIHT